MGTVELSGSCPQAGLLTDHHPRSDPCGIVGKRSPQAVDESFVHRGSEGLSTGNPQGGPGCPQLLHTPVHCSATNHPLSPRRVKGVTPRGTVGLWGTWVKLGTALGRTPHGLCIGCAELSGVHRAPRLSTDSTHRRSGQKTGPDLGKRRYPPFPQALLLLPHRVSPEFASKWDLCTTRRRSSDALSSRLDPEQHRVSAAYVRLVPAVDEEPATSRRRFR